jgi:hypothetical protein
VYQRKIAFAAAILILGVATNSSVSGNSHIVRSISEQEGHAVSAVPDTVAQTVEEVRQMVVGTWIQDAGDNTKGTQKWVFTEDGTLRKYRRKGGSYQLEDTNEYTITGQRNGQRAPESIAAYLKIFPENGEVYYGIIRGISRGESPQLFIQFTTGASVSNFDFEPPKSFE